MFSVILVNNSKEDADENIHADDDVNNKINAVPVVCIVGRNSETQDI